MSVKNEILAIKKALKYYYNLRKNEEYLDWCNKYVGQLKKFRNIHKGHDCFILGNGPSLNRTDLNRLNDFYVFGTNKIFLIFDKVDLNLSYHLSVNSLMIEQSKMELEKGLNCPSFLSYSASKNVIEDCEHIFRFYTKSAPWTFTGDFTKPVSEGYTITSVALQLAFYMGFERVFLVGVDHNFKQKGKPNTIQVSDAVDVNHFTPNYVGGKEWYLADLEASEISYRQAKYYFETNGRKIYDATLDGKLTVFDKISFEEAVQMCKKK